MRRLGALHVVESHGLVGPFGKTIDDDDDDDLAEGI